MEKCYYENIDVYIIRYYYNDKFEFSIYQSIWFDIELKFDGS